MTDALVKTLFDEFKYRHELFWKLIGSISAVVLALDVLPFLKGGGKYDFGELKSLFFMLPAVASLIAFFGVLLLLAEYRLLAFVEKSYNGKKGDLDINTKNDHVLDHRWIGYSVIFGWGAALSVLSAMESVELFKRLQ